MDNIGIVALLALLGLFSGSFAGATVWRLRAHQLREDEVAGEKNSAKEKRQVEKLQKSTLLKDRSVCLHCGHQLAWFDLIPLFSWALLRGRCRYCHKRIGGFEPVIELGMAAFYVVSYLYWPASLETVPQLVQFLLWLIVGTGLAILSVYDLKWFLLPNRVMLPLIGLGVVNGFVQLSANQYASSELLNIFYACLVLSGLYYLIYVVSKHKWVGFGDIKLGLVLALMLGDWQLAILTLFFANALGTVIVLPLMLSGKMKRSTRIPFGPLLISGWFIAGLFGGEVVRWYLTLAIGSA
jgi:prepilin signal peptidase PulO-like enzyme (type II secretory pathway)